jgi:hypothetical protein
MADTGDSPHKKSKLEELDTTAPYADRPEDPTATAILRKKKKPNVYIPLLFGTYTDLIEFDC